MQIGLRSHVQIPCTLKEGVHDLATFHAKKPSVRSLSFKHLDKFFYFCQIDRLIITFGCKKKYVVQPQASTFQIWAQSANKYRNETKSLLHTRRVTIFPTKSYSHNDETCSCLLNNISTCGGWILKILSVLESTQYYQSLGVKHFHFGRSWKICPSAYPSGG